MIDDERRIIMYTVHVHGRFGPSDVAVAYQVFVQAERS
jgi:hypothetical protein